MQFPESWLRSFCNPPLTTTELADLLTMAGMEVEDTRPVAPPFEGVVVAEILSAEPHPGADRLRVCRVSVGAGEPLQIVCGAPNARAGIRVPLAQVGALLPPGEDGKPFAIKVGKLRGVESFGMLCSARELGISDEQGGLLELDGDAPLGQSIRVHLNLDDTLFTLKLTPNLGHALSVLGVAREVAALTGAPLTVPAMPPVATALAETRPVHIEAPDLCGRFAGRIVRGVNPQARTPAWMVQRLAGCGQRSVAPLVDISNYVMFELGRPSHIFDLDRIAGDLHVRWAKAGEQIELLNGKTIELQTDVGVIADAEKPESLAGIMGGEATAVGDATRNVYIEAAFWWPEAVAGRSRRLGFATEAGHRFERGVDAASIPEHLERITALVLAICGGEAGPITDTIAALPVREPVRLRVARAAKVIGMPVSEAECAEVLQRLSLPFTQEGGVFTVTPPSWRFDLTLEEDLIEEVIRVLGYARLPDTPPQGAITARWPTEGLRSSHAVRHALAGLGYQETINYSFVEARWEAELAGNADPIRVLNPIAAPLAVMRSSLIGSLVQVLRHNLARKAERVRVFELGRVFRRDPGVPSGPLTVAGIDQPMRVAGLAWGPADMAQWGQPERRADFFDAKGDVQALLAPQVATFVPAEHPALHPGRAAAVVVDGQTIGHVGELHPRWRQGYELPYAPVVFELDLAAVRRQPVPQGRPVPRQQAVQRDVALVVDDAVTHDALVGSLAADAEGLVQDVRLFDIYKLPGGERSLALRLTLQDDAQPLTDARIDAAVQAAVARTAPLGARLRG